MLPPRAKALVDCYMERMDRESSGLLQGLYLVGSVALDDFHDAVSDVDFVTVAKNPDPKLLRKVHEGLAKFDGLYVTSEDLRTSPSKLGHGYYYLDAELRRGDEGRSLVVKPEHPDLERQSAVIAFLADGIAACR